MAARENMLETAPHLRRSAYAHMRKVRAFQEALAQLCANFDVCLVHEDGHGLAHIIPCREGEAAHCAIEVADYELHDDTRKAFL